MIQETPPRLRVLVIDDDKALQIFYLTLLTRYHYTVDCVPDGRMAIANVQNTNYDAIILDLMMPNINGYEFIDFLMQDKPEALEHVLVVTGASTAQIEKVPLERVLRKPFELTELLDHVAECANHHAGSVANSLLRHLQK